jgi:hypothetical protein
VTIGGLRFDVLWFRRGEPTAAIAESMSFLRRLKIPAVDFFHLEGVYVDPIDASDVDGRHFCAGLRVRPDCE